MFDMYIGDDMHRYDLEENVWTKINTEKKPKGRNFARYLKTELNTNINKKRKQNTKTKQT